MKTLFLCGGGNPDGIRLAQRINQQSFRWDRILVLDDDSAKHGRSMLGAEIVGGFAHLATEASNAAEVANLVARTTAKRWSAGNRIRSYGATFASLTHPTVDIDGATLAHEVMIYQNATIGAEAVVGEGTVVFMGAVVGHECRVGRGCVVAANAVLNARVQLGDGAYVGANATILPEVSVGAWATIGAGSVVLRDVPAGTTVMGVPAQTITARPETATELAATPPAWSAGAAEIGGEETHVGDPHFARSDLEPIILHIWGDVLQLPTVNPNENFFDLGGDSLCALHLHEEIRRALRIDLHITDLYRFPTVRSLVGHLSNLHHGPATLSGASSRGAARRRMLQNRGAFFA
ncbi:MAG: phosphopantetheine-binding protein [Planctomycetota bacterium]